MDKQTKGVLIGASAGLIAGALAGVLFAPQAGKKTISDIAGHMNDMKDKIAKEMVKNKTLTQEKYDEIVDKTVKIYKLEKKLSAKQADDISKSLKNNYAHVVAIIKK